MSSKNLDVLFIFRNFNYGKPGMSHMGLGVNANHTINVLTRMGYNVKAYGAWQASDVVDILNKHPDPPRHCVLEAPWVSLENTLNIINSFPSTHFSVRCHSNVGFLQVEAGAINLIRETVLHSEMVPNLSLSGNSSSFCDFIEKVYHGRCVYLPNLYNYERVGRRSLHRKPHHILKAGSFGAIRLQKNHITGAAAALILARELGVDLEFYLTTNREEGAGSKGVVQAIQNLFTGLSWAKLVCLPWSSWAIFRRHIAEMNVCFHLSATETFNLTTADALAEGVGVVGSEVIDWLPLRWRANIDNATHAAEVGKHIIHDYNTMDLCERTLKSVCSKNEYEWKRFLGDPDKYKY